MSIGSITYRLVSAGTVAGLLMAAELLITVPAHASCPEGQQEDPSTRMCWSQSAQGTAFSSGDAPCLPGRVGDCVGQLRPNPLQPSVPQIDAGPVSPDINDIWVPSNQSSSDRSTSGGRGGR